MKTAIVTGVLGMDGSYLSKLLLEKGYIVVGTHRRHSCPNLDNIAGIINHKDFILEECDITDYACVSGLMKKYKPDEVYNLAAQSHVHTSFEQPIHTFEADTIGPLNFLEVIRQYHPNTKFYQASTSELFGKNYSVSFLNEKYQDENTPFIPQSPYAIAKLAAHHMVRLYRESYNIFSCCGILFNHEGPRRGINFVTRKITDYVARLKLGLTQEKLQLGNLDAVRDWGHAKDYVKAMYLMLQQEKPDDFVICTGESHTVREFCETAFLAADMDYKPWVEINQAFFRPAEVDFLRGVSLKAKNKLGWSPEVTFSQLVEEMVQHDIKRLQSRIS